MAIFEKYDQALPVEVFSQGVLLAKFSSAPMAALAVQAMHNAFVIGEPYEIHVMGMRITDSLGLLANPAEFLKLAEIRALWAYEELKEGDKVRHVAVSKERPNSKMWNVVEVLEIRPDGAVKVRQFVGREYWVGGRASADPVSVLEHEAPPALKLLEVANARAKWA